MYFVYDIMLIFLLFSGKQKMLKVNRIQVLFHYMSNSRNILHNQFLPLNSILNF